MADYEPVAFPSWCYNLQGTPRLVRTASEFASLPGSNWSFAPFVSRLAEVPVTTPVASNVASDAVRAQANANATDATIQQKTLAANRAARVVTTGTTNPRHGH